MSRKPEGMKNTYEENPMLYRHVLYMTLWSSFLMQ